MRNRLERGRLHKAQRGELFHRVPTGYVKLSTDRVEMDPDEQVREVVRLIFDKYDELGTAWGVFHYLIRNNIRLGFRPFHGPNRGNLEWRRPVLLTVFQILRHPIYAGAYTYGRRPHKRVRTADGRRTTAGNWVPMDQWKVLKLDCLPAYITWDRYLANQESCINIAQVRAPRGALATVRRCWPASSSAAIAVVASRHHTGLKASPITVVSGTSTRGPSRCASASRRRRSTTW